VSYLFGTTENLQDGDRLGWFWTIMQVIVAVSVAPDRREMQIEARMMVEAEISLLPSRSKDGGRQRTVWGIPVDGAGGHLKGAAERRVTLRSAERCPMGLQPF